MSSVFIPDDEFQMIQTPEFTQMIIDQYSLENNEKSEDDYIKKNLPSIQVTTKSTKTNKGRPKKCQKNKYEKNINEQSIFSQHQKVLFSLTICYAFRALKNYPKISKYGFLHQSIANQDCYYEDLNEALENNSFLQKEGQLKFLIKSQIESDHSFANFIQKIIWIGPIQIVDQIIYVIARILQKSKTIEDMRIKQEIFIQDLLKLVEKLLNAESQYYWNNLIFINFRNPKLKINKQQNQKLIYLEFLEFLRVLITSVILIKLNFQENPFFIKYFSGQNFEAEAHPSPEKLKKKVIIEPIDEQQNEKEQIQPQILIKSVKTKKIKKQKTIKKPSKKSNQQEQDQYNSNSEEVYEGDFYS